MRYAIIVLVLFSFLGASAGIKEFNGVQIPKKISHSYYKIDQKDVFSTKDNYSRYIWPGALLSAYLNIDVTVDKNGTLSIQATSDYIASKSSKELLIEYIELQIKNDNIQSLKLDWTKKEKKEYHDRIAEMGQLDTKSLVPFLKKNLNTESKAFILYNGTEKKPIHKRDLQKIVDILDFHTALSKF